MTALAAQGPVPADHTLGLHAAGPLLPLLRARWVSQGEPDDHMERSVQQSEMLWIAAAAAAPGSKEGHMCLVERTVDCAVDCAAEQQRGAGLGVAG